MTEGWPADVVERHRRSADARERIRAEDPALFEAFAEAFFRVDPISINFETNTDEYEPEVGTLLPRMNGASSAEDVARLLREELTNWFYPGSWSETRVQLLADELWSIWNARGSA